MSSSKRSRFLQLFHQPGSRSSASTTTTDSAPSPPPAGTAANGPTTVERDIAPVGPFPLGLEVLAEGVNPTVDIVAVHGLNGHRSKTWTADNGVHWLRDLLPTDVPAARIVSWGYDANTHAKSRVSCQYLYDHARALVSDLCRMRKISEAMERPIIFVVHSLGGIVVKSALIHSDAARERALEDHRSIKVSTYGIIFMGTPHQGGNGVELGKLLVNVASLFVAADNRLLRHLERDSEWLLQQLGQYGPISSDFVTKFAFETYKTPTALGHSIMVVPRASAVVPSQADAETIQINANHRDMVRYSSSKDQGYMMVSEHLKIMALAATEDIRSRWRTERRVVEAHRGNSDAPYFVSFSLSDVVEAVRFVARSDELERIHIALRGSHHSRRTVVVHGLGGMGKTQLAAEYAKRHRDEYSAVFWMTAKDESSLKQAYAKVARRISLDHPTVTYMENALESDDLDRVVQATKQWLDRAGNSRWLLIYDNYDTPAFGWKDADGPRTGLNVGEASDGYDIRPFFPDTHHGAILITTRLARVKLGCSISLTKLRETKHSLEILADASDRENLAEDPDAIELARKLDGLPLALATAGAYLNNVTITFAEYIAMHQESWLRLQMSTPGLLSYEDRALHSTWNISYTEIAQRNPDAAMLLTLLAYFDNEDVWFQLLEEIRRTPPERDAPRYTGPAQPSKMGWLRYLTDDMLKFNEAVRILCDYGLLEANKPMNRHSSGAGSMGYSMHACVQSWAAHRMSDEVDADMVRIVVHCVALHILDNEEPRWWEVDRRLLQHALRCYTALTRDHIEMSEGGEWALHRLGVLFLRHGWLREAELMSERALYGREKTLGREHLATLETVNTLGTIYTKSGRFAAAEDMYMRALEGREKLWGPGHAETLKTLNNFGILYQAKGDLSKAEEMYKSSIAGKERDESMGVGHVSTLQTLQNLASIYRRQDRPREAEETLKRVLNGFEKALGQDQAKTYVPALCALMGLGELYTSQGRLAEARERLLLCKSGRQDVYGTRHREYLMVVEALARLQEAELTSYLEYEFNVYS